MPGLLPPAVTLAFDKGLIGQLVFVLIALLAWVLRAAAERRAAQRQAEDDGAPAQPGVLERLASLVDPEDAEERAREERIDRRARERRAQYPEAYVGAEPSPPPVPDAEGREAEQTPGRSRIASKPLESVGPRLQTQLASDTLPDDAPARPLGPRSVRRRLGLEAGGGRRPLRAAVLWSEVLGPPRAFAGPHRTPLQRRMQRT